MGVVYGGVVFVLTEVRRVFVVVVFFSFVSQVPLCWPIRPSVILLP